MPLPAVAIIVLHYKNWEDTLTCVQSIMQSDYTEKHIYIVDNDETKSPPATLSNITNGQVTLISNDQNYGFAGGLNQALKLLVPEKKCDCFWLLNNDTLVEKQAISELVKYAGEKPKCAIIGSKILKNTPNGYLIQGIGGMINRWTGRTKHLGENEQDNGQYNDTNIQFDYVMGAAMFVPRWYFEKNGYFDETNFLYGEEIDIAYTCKKHGFELGFCPNAILYHEESSSVGNRSPIHDYYNVRNSLYVAKKNYPYYLPFIFVSNIFFTLLPKVLRGQWSRIKIILKAYHDFLISKYGKMT
jgi:GT2 family glycosyltransferase